MCYEDGLDNVSWDTYFDNFIESNKKYLPYHFDEYKQLMYAYKDIVKEVLPEGVIANLSDYAFRIESGLDKNNVYRSKVFVYDTKGMYTGSEWISSVDIGTYLCKFRTENFKRLD